MEANSDGIEEQIWQPNTLVLAATPIGNVRDATDRLRLALQTADLIAAEDTRKLRALAARMHVEIYAKLVSCHEHNESQRAEAIIERVSEGAKVLFVSDAGMPTVSDPGFDLVRAAQKNGVRVTVVPGPSAALTALAVSGLPPRRFCFEGFLPRKSGQLKAVLESLQSEPRTMIFFESPRRLQETLTMMAEVFGDDREACVCRELTKTYEDVWRGELGELAKRADNPRGEIVIVVAGAQPKSAAAVDLVDLVQAKVASGVRMKDATKQIATEYGCSAKELYDLMTHC